MYHIRRATSNTAAPGILASLTTNTSYAKRNLLQTDVDTFSRYLQICLRWAASRSRQAIQNVIHSVFRYLQICLRWTANRSRLAIQSVSDFIFRYLQICLRWTALQSRQAIAALWRALRIPELLHSIHLIFLRILKLCGIALATAISVTIVLRIGYWGVPKLLEVYNESRMRRLEEGRQIEQRRQRMASLSDLRAKEAAEAAAKKEARLRQVREDQARKAKQKRDEDMRQTKARADYMSWEMECDAVFRNRASMTKFPFPPLLRCTDSTCPGVLKKPVPACPHNVQQFFRGSGNFSLVLLKRQRPLWHPDRFASCRADLSPEFSRLANSLFVILDPWYEELKGKEANASSAG